jgi:hypothetical protein
VIRRLLRKAFVLALIAAVLGAAVVAARKLMGGLGPEPGSSEAPREWPSLVPDPPAPEASTVGGPSGNGHAAGGTAPSETAEL